MSLALFPQEPSKVQNPTASHSARDDYLRVYWRRPTGDFDFYQVFIKHNNVLLQNKTLPKSLNECVFTGLVPGRLYTVLVSTWSGKYETSVSTHGRTCEFTHRHSRWQRVLVWQSQFKTGRKCSRPMSGRRNSKKKTVTSPRI